MKEKININEKERLKNVFLHFIKRKEEINGGNGVFRIQDLSSIFCDIVDELVKEGVIIEKQTQHGVGYNLKKNE